MSQQRTVCIGGMMRCCIDTVRDFESHAAADLVVRDGDALFCQHEGPRQDAPPIIFRDGAWGWNADDLPGRPLNARPLL